ncbi:MAG: hypothetical protein EPO25_11560 [Gammaproteobacteria bacterium]|nr:MAG: hypothetical protein EPO25_11560 [Gammaproteobacteria bacterium]
MNTAKRHVASLKRLGGHPALDFVNTVHAWPPDRDDEYLHDYAALLGWLGQAGLFDEATLDRLAAASPAAAGQVHARALRLRAALHALFAAVARRAPLPQPALDELAAVLQETLAWRRLTAAGDRLRSEWELSEAAPLAALGPIAWAALELLEHGPLGRVRECPPPDGCGWLFLDASRNRTRHWCSMQGCGNTAKARRFRERRRATARAAGRPRTGD